MAALRFRLADDFTDPACDAARWEELLLSGKTNVLFLTRSWLESWWDALHRGKLLLVVAERGGETIALAPLFAEEGMIFFLGAGESDYLGFIGDISDPEVLTGLLALAIEATPGFLGIRLHLVPADAGIADALAHTATTLQLHLFLERELPACEVDLRVQADAVRLSTNRSMLKREMFFQRNGAFRISRFRSFEDIEPNLEPFFQQHIDRWKGKEYRSPFERPRIRRWLSRVCQVSAADNSARVIRMDWKDQMLGISFAWHHRGVHYSGPWSFASEHGKHCPGHVLLRHSLLWALEENLHTYDLRGGEDHYKSRLETVLKMTHSWGLFPTSSLQE